MLLGARELACVGQDRQQGEEVPGSVPGPVLGVAVPALPRCPLSPDLVSTGSFLGLGPSHQAFLSRCPQGEDRAVDAVASAVCSSPKPGLSFAFNSLGVPTIAVTCYSRALFCLRTWFHSLFSLQKQSRGRAAPACEVHLCRWPSQP